MEVSIKIFDEDCFAFQPFYKLEKATVKTIEDGKMTKDLALITSLKEMVEIFLFIK